MNQSSLNLKWDMPMITAPPHRTLPARGRCERYALFQEALQEFAIPFQTPLSYSTDLTIGTIAVTGAASAAPATWV